jgi:hypothetical protein
MILRKRKYNEICKRVYWIYPASERTTRDNNNNIMMMMMMMMMMMITIAALDRTM